MDFNDALRQFEAVQANLVQLEGILQRIRKNIPEGIVYGANPAYEADCRWYEHYLPGLPAIDGWKPTALPLDLDAIAAARHESFDLSEPTIEIELDREIERPGKELREYRFKFNQKRRELIREIIFKIFVSVDILLEELSSRHLRDKEVLERVLLKSDPQFVELENKVREIDVLLGSSVSRPQRWSDLQRHLRYGDTQDLGDIIRSDWPNVKAGITEALQAYEQPIPVQVKDLAELLNSKLTGTVVTKLKWDNLSSEDFERLIFNLFKLDVDHQNVSWLTRTNAPDRGRDVSAERVSRNKLSGVTHQRVIIQCKHWLSKSIGVAEVSAMKEEIKLWEPPRVDVLVIATSGRFTSDAIAWVERHQQSDSALRIEMWPDSHLESLLAAHPELIASYGLR